MTALTTSPVPDVVEQAAGRLMGALALCPDVHDTVVDVLADMYDAAAAPTVDPESLVHAPAAPNRLGDALCGADTGRRSRIISCVTCPDCVRLGDEPEPAPASAVYLAAYGAGPLAIERVVKWLAAGVAVDSRITRGGWVHRPVDQHDGSAR